MTGFAVLLGFALAAPAPAPLAVVNAGIEQTEGGAALPKGFEHVPGEILFFTFQVHGYAAPERKFRLRYRIDTLDPQGIPVVRPIERPIEGELAPQDKDWRPRARHEVPLPPLAPSGTYKFVVEVADEVAKTTVKHEVPFIVRGRSVPPSENLVLRNFAFYRSDEATESLRKAAYRPGDAVWARFDITGFRHGPENRIDVAYGIAVLNAEGKQLWAQPEAAVERSESFYPKPYVPGSMSLSLEPNIRPGEYAIVITAKDAIGGQTWEEKHTFVIE
jgi:hypothetical protein